MWIQVRSMDGKKSARVDGLSKLTKIEDLREKLVENFEAPPERQRLFYRGKQLVDGHTLFDYNVGLNEIIQIMVRQALPDPKTSPVKGQKLGGDNSEEDGTVSNKENQEPNIGPGESTSEKLDSQESGFDEDMDSLYRIGDVIDARDETMGAWFEAKISKITKDNSQNILGEKKVIKEKLSEESNDTKENALNDCNGNVVDKENEGDIEMTDEENVDSKENKDDNTQNKADTEAPSSSKGVQCPWDKDVFLDGYVYDIIYEGYEEDEAVKLTSKNIRPRARHLIKFNDIQVGNAVMVNYNYDEPEARGYWYDAIVTEKRNTRTIKEIYCTVFIGKDLVPMEKCQVLFRDEIFELEKPGSQLNRNDPEAASQSPTKRKNKPECDHCQDNPRRKCTFCACHHCGQKNNPDKTLLCDECDNAYHIYCLTPPLKEIPDVDEWYCPLCKNDASEVVQAGEKLKESKKKSKMASAKQTSTRDWGKGMACVGRTKVCNIVPANHFGPIPGIEVGTMWKFRVQVSEAGVHRPHVAGIHGREEEGSYSIVLSGGYEDDVDDGDEFTYTGSGGRDLSGNKRTAEQSCDQILSRMNMALAKNCNAPMDKKKGGEAKDWRAGKPVRVVRNCKGRKHSKYAPEEGNRYDGIYKVVKVYPQKGQSGFLVWRYLIRRDDPNPAPWTKEGKKRSKEAGLVMQYPDGYLEAQAEKEKEKEKNETPGKGKGKGKGKRKRDEEEEEHNSSPVKKPKMVRYKVDDEIMELIKEDTANSKLWEEAEPITSKGAQAYLAKVEELFLCVCCQDIVFKPVTTACCHNICKSCLSRSFKADVTTCPACRAELGKDFKMTVNKPLSSALHKLFPGYENGRE